MTYPTIPAQEQARRLTAPAFMLDPTNERSWATAPAAYRFGSGARVLFTVALLLTWHNACGGQAHAEPGQFELGARLAPSLDTHVGEREFAENTYKLGFSVGAGLRYGLLDWLSIQTEFLFATRGSRVEADGETINGFDFRYIQIPALAHYGFRVPGLDSDGLRPAVTGYVVAGPALSILLDADNIDETRSLPRSALSSLDVSVTAGLGVAWHMAPRRTASLEVRFDRGFIDPFIDTDLTLKNQAILLALGIDYALVYDEDFDDDGVVDALDQCPTEDEDEKPPHLTDGCPDTDEDGMIDGADQCPMEAEDSDGYQDEDGCPDPDNDGDTILDVEDKCPNEPFPYSKGLTHPRRGCQPRFLRVRIEGDRLVLDPTLVFDKKEPLLTLEGKKKYVFPPLQVKTLDVVAELMTDYYPRMVLRLEAYADGKGDPQYNEKLSAARAKAVADYLINEKKIDPERLVEKGYGEVDPIRRESDDQSREENRRVELIIIGLEVDLKQK